MSDDDKVVSFQAKLPAEKIYQKETKEQFETEEFKLGEWTSYSILTDPRHIVFVLARYKFVSKMLEGKDSVIDLGCGDGVGTPILSQTIKHVINIDWDNRLIAANKIRLKNFKNVDHYHYDINREDIPLANIDACALIDVIEHVEPMKEDVFIKRICKCLKPDGIIIIGTPNKCANIYASPQSQAQHINLKSYEDLRQITQKYYKNVFMFSMSDEIVHTGFGSMAHYIWSVGVGIKQQYLL